MLGTKLTIFWLGLLALSYGSVSDVQNDGFSESDGGLYTDDAVILNVYSGRAKRDISNSTRDGRQILLLRPRQQAVGAYGMDCKTTLGKKGSCKSFRDCYPLFKVADLSGWDGWVMGHYDTCSYVNNDNNEVFGVCCTEPVGTPPQQEPDVQRFGYIQPPIPVHFPPAPLSGLSGGVLSALTRWSYGDSSVRQIPAQWPPAIPTHPPDHTPATHPPSLVAGVTTKPPNSYPTTSTTWATKPPSTTKQTWAPAYPTKPSVPAAAVDGSCGRKNGPQTYESTYQDEERIVGGHNAELNEWPWIVALFNAGRQFCGGSLMDDRHVLSAAHCVAHMTSWDVARLTARLGDYNIRTNTETQHVERKIKRVVRHRGFDMRTLYNDVAVLTLDQPVSFTNNIRPICLPSGGRASYQGKVATVIGWGSLRESGPQPSVLQEVSIPIWSNQECQLKYGGAAPGGIVEHMLCAGKASMDSCSGDSGGPLMVNENGRWTQVGIVSWGIGCGKGQYPGVYTRVTYFMPWIQKNSQ
ncbi:transmembrane protease serine 9-like isoform X1 [Trichoplusia ni]|uniref:Phenoloxidase-activating factor 2 n=1 Tax=Trichoplusia ni TaxID=7111 RepID=A0A7E5VSY9_TRINI|nr:transmembrane protease serine 9-like isoform X1 [Trichoplusia ni]